MIDILMVIAVIAFFALTIGLIKALDKLKD